MFPLYAQRNDNRTLAAAAYQLLLLLVRGPEFFFVLMVATPMCRGEHCWFEERDACITPFAAAIAASASSIIIIPSSDWNYLTI
jgi:hypothetical protein